MTQKIAPSGRRRVALISLLAFLCTIAIATLAGHQGATGRILPYSRFYPWGTAVSTERAVTDKVAIVMIDTRAPVVPSDPGEELSFWTVAILHNYLYAKSVGVPFKLFNLEPLTLDDGVTLQLDEGEGDVRLPAYCRHPRYGFRMVAFCKLLVVWEMWQRNPDLDYMVIIDSDAVFKSPDNHIQTHLDHLSRRHPAGFLKDLPYDNGPCAGYWFTTRGSAALMHEGDRMGNETGIEFLEDWWNLDWALTNYKYDREQGLLKKMVHDRIDTDQVNAVVLDNEWQFEDRHPHQMVVHVNHLQHGKQAALLGQYFSWPDYDLAGREALRNLLDEIETHTVDLGPIALDVEMKSNRRKSLV